MYKTDDKEGGHDFANDHSYRFYLITRDATSIGPESDFDGTLWGSVRRNQATGGSRGPIRVLIEMITRAKAKRLVRDLELRGVCYDQRSHSRVTVLQIDAMAAAIDKAAAGFGKSSSPRPAPTAAPSFSALVRRAVRSLVGFLLPEWLERTNNYQPERHYMRGPGPKAREKEDRYRIGQGN
jgi:hypothetical protein